MDNITLSGFKELDKLVKSMPEAVGYKFTTEIFTAIYKRSFIPIVKSKIPVGRKWGYSAKYSSRIHPPGNLRDSIGTVVGRSRRTPSVYCGPKSRMAFGRGSTKADGWYAHMIEFGHKKRNGEMQPPQPFMRPSWDIALGTIKKDIIEAYKAQLKKEVRKYQKYTA
jgi:hypothetical protein